MLPFGDIRLAKPLDVVPNRTFRCYFSRSVTEWPAWKAAAAAAATAGTEASAARLLWYSATVFVGRALDRRQRYVRGGGRRVVGQQATQAQAPEHGGRGRADPPTVSAAVPTAPATVRARVRRTSAPRLVVVDAVDAHVAVRPGPVVRPLRSGRGKASATARP